MLVDPKINQHQEKNTEMVKERWIKINNNNKDKCEPKAYSIGEDEPQVIDENGFLKLEWTDEMSDFDFLLATPVKPNPRRLLTIEEIVNRMNEKGYYSYFKNNDKYGINTFEDVKIKNRIEE